MTIKALVLACALLAAAPSVSLAQASAERTPVVSVTQHAGRFNGQAVKYQAIVAEAFLQDAAGAPARLGGHTRPSSAPM